MNFTFFNPVRLIFGQGEFSKLGIETSKLGKKALIVTYSGEPFDGFSKKAMEYLKEEGVEGAIFSDVEANPMASTVRKGADLAQSEGCDVIIGLGGGSAMDTAKGIAFLTGKEGDIFDYILGKKVGSDALPSVMLTTTAGTGSEGNWTAVFTNDETLEKKGLVNPLIYPKVSIVDFNFMKTLPKPLIAGPGLDALFHAFESYISKNANPMSEMYSLEAMRLSIEYLPKVYHNPEDNEAWEKVVIANTLAGIAIGCAGTTMPHAMGQPISGLLNVAHSDSLICVYMPFMRFTATHAPKKFAVLAKLMGCDVEHLSDVEAALLSIDAMESFINSLDASKRLSDVGVKEEHLDIFADVTTNIMKVVLSNNPIVPTREQVKELYYECL